MSAKQLQRLVSAKDLLAFVEPIRSSLTESFDGLPDTLVIRQGCTGHKKAWQLIQFIVNRLNQNCASPDVSLDEPALITWYTELSKGTSRKRKRRHSYRSFFPEVAEFRLLMHSIAEQSDKAESPMLTPSDAGFILRWDKADPSKSRPHSRKKDAFEAPISSSDNPGAEKPDWETVVEIQLEMLWAETSNVQSLDYAKQVHEFELRASQTLKTLEFIQLSSRGPALTVQFTGEYSQVERLHQIIDCVIKLIDELAQSHPDGDAGDRHAVAIRVGIDTAKVPVLSQAKTYTRFCTHAVTAALRLCRAAVPNQILIGPACRDLIEGAYDCEYKSVDVPRADHEPPLVGFEVLARKSDSIASFEPTSRIAKLDQLRDALKKADSSHPMVCCLAGASGVGKTRLLREFIRMAAYRAISTAVIGCECRRLEVNTPLFPITRAIRLEAKLDGADQQLKSSITPEIRSRLSGCNISEVVADDTSESLCACLLELAKQQTVVLVLDKYEFADSHTCSWLNRLIRTLLLEKTAIRFMIVVAGTLVPELMEERLEKDRSMMIELASLASAAAGRVFDKILESKAHTFHVDEHTKSRLLAHLSGIPGEISNSIAREQRSSTLQKYSRPTATVDPSGAPSMDVLGPYLEGDDGRMRVVLQAVALLEEPVPERCLNALIEELRPPELPISNLGEALNELLIHHVIHRDERKDENFYWFTTSLYYQAALRLIDAHPQPKIRRAVVEILATHGGKLLDLHPEVRAMNLQWGGSKCLDDAINAWEEAGKSLRQYESWRKQTEAAQCYTNATQLMPQTTENCHRRLRLICDQIAILAAAGYIPPRRKNLLQTAKRLNETLQDPDIAFFLRREEWSNQHNETRFDISASIAEDLANAWKNDRAKTIEALHCLGLSTSAGGKLQTSLQAFQQAVEMWKEESNPSPSAWSDHDAGPCCAINASLLSCLRGENRQSTDFMNEAHHLLERSTMERTRAVVLIYSGLVSILNDDFESARQFLATSNKVKSAAGRRWNAIKYLLDGAVMALATESEPERRINGIQQMTDCLNRLEDRGERALSTFWVCFIARAELENHSPEAALKILQRVQDLNHHERIYAAEFQRLRAEAILSVTGVRSDASVDFERAAETAKDLGARRLWERVLSTTNRLGIQLSDRLTSWETPPLTPESKPWSEGSANEPSSS